MPTVQARITLISVDGYYPDHRGLDCHAPCEHDTGTFGLGKSKKIMIDIFGLGECGSSISFRLFEELYPAQKLDEQKHETISDKVLSGLVAVTKAFLGGDGPEFNVVKFTFQPHIYIGDLNKDNKNYRRHLLAQKINEALDNLPTLKNLSKETLEKAKAEIKADLVLKQAHTSSDFYNSRKS